MEFEATPVTDVRCELGESPLWLPGHGELAWLDIAGHELHRFAPERQTTRSIPLTAEVSAIGLGSDTELIAAVHDGFGWVDLATGEVRNIGDRLISHPLGRMNDGAVGPDGAFWGGSKLPADHAAKGGLWRLDASGTTRRVVDRATISNGLDWFPGQSSRMLYVDSASGGVDQLTIAPDGSVVSRTRVIDIDPVVGEPDGLTIDAEGQVWVAIWGGAQVLRYDAAGTHTATIRTSAEHTSSCCFGGADGRTLFITSAREGLAAPGPADGCLFACRLPVGGQRSRVFGTAR